MTLKKIAVVLSLALVAGAVQAQQLPLSAGAGIRDDGVTSDGTSVQTQRELNQSKGRDTAQQVNVFDLLRSVFVLPPDFAEPAALFMKRTLGAEMLLGHFCDAGGYFPKDEKYAALRGLNDEQRAYACAQTIFASTAGNQTVGWPGRPMPMNNDTRKFLNTNTYGTLATIALFQEVAEKLANLPPMSMQDLRERARQELYRVATTDGRPEISSQVFRDMYAKERGPWVQRYELDLGPNQPAPVHYKAHMRDGSIWDMQLSPSGALVRRNGSPIYGDGYIEGVQYMASVTHSAGATQKRGAAVTSQDTTEIRSETNAQAGTQ